MFGKSKLSQNTEEINSFDKVKTWIKSAFPLSKHLRSNDAQDKVTVADIPAERVNRPIVFRSMSLPESISLRTERPHFNNLQRICNSALGDMSFKRRDNVLSQSFRRTNVLGRTRSADIEGGQYHRRSIDESSEHSPKVEATVEYSPSCKKASVLTIILHDKENGNDTTQVDVITCSSASSSTNNGNWTTSVCKHSPQLDIRHSPQLDIRHSPQLDIRRSSIANVNSHSFEEQDDNTFTLTPEKSNSRHCHEFLQKNIRESKNAQATQLPLLRRSFSAEEGTKTIIDIDEIQKKLKNSAAARVITSIQYFKTCQQLRVILKKAENLQIRKRKVFATANLVNGYVTVEKWKGKAVRGNTETVFNQAIYFENVAAEDLHGMNLSIELHTKRYPLSKPTEIGRCDIKLNEYDLTMDVTLLGILRPKSCHNQSSSSRKYDVQVISRDNSMYAQACSVSNVPPRSPLNMKRTYRINSTPALVEYRVTND